MGLEMRRFPGKKPVMRVLAVASCFSNWILMFPGEGARPKEDCAMSMATSEASSSASGHLKSLQVPVPAVAPVPPTPTAKETVGSSQTPVWEGLPPLGTAPVQGCACAWRPPGIMSWPRVGEEGWGGLRGYTTLDNLRGNLALLWEARVGEVDLEVVLVLEAVEEVEVMEKVEWRQQLHHSPLY